MGRERGPFVAAAESFGLCPLSSGHGMFRAPEGNAPNGGVSYSWVLGEPPNSWGGKGDRTSHFALRCCRLVLRPSPPSVRRGFLQNSQGHAPNGGV
eukprot:6284825-Pyramimonas_sp.AAC.1